MENPILVTGAAGRVGAVGRTVTELLLKQGKAVRAMVRNEDERARRRCATSARRSWSAIKTHGIHRLIVMGLIAHTCVEATVRYAAELGYDVTMVKDATADYSDDAMHAALDINILNYASAIVSTNEVVDSISSL